MKPSRYLSLVVLALALVAIPAIATAQAPTVEVARHDDLGPMLVDSEGRTLYAFSNDSDGASNCLGDCAALWPPLLLTEGEPAGGGGVAGLLGLIVRSEGGRQATYNGRPLYRYAQDVNPGDTNGQGMANAWYVVHPDAPSIAAADQEIEGDTVTISRVVVMEGSWVVIHADQGGSPGAIIGEASVAPGENLAVEVLIDTLRLTERLHAMVHRDRGDLGQFEFPGADPPLTLGGAQVTAMFAVTAAPAAVATSAATEPAPTVAATAEPTSAPATPLPATPAAPTPADTPVPATEPALAAPAATTGNLTLPAVLGLATLVVVIVAVLLRRRRS